MRQAFAATLTTWFRFVVVLVLVVSRVRGRRLVLRLLRRGIRGVATTTTKSSRAMAVNAAVAFLLCRDDLYFVTTKITPIAYFITSQLFFFA